MSPIVLAAALIPPIYLMIRIYHMDKVEREPIGLILKLFLFGSITVIPAALLESAIIPGLAASFGATTLAFAVVENFFGVGLVEELVKYWGLKLGSWRSREFNYRFDAVVYATTVALGFAAAENIGYVASYGLNVALIRAVTSIPGHCIFGIYMGVHYGQAKHYERLGNERKKRQQLRLAIISPMILHGAYDLIASSGNPVTFLLFYVYVIVLDIFAIKRIRQQEAVDRPIEAPDASEAPDANEVSRAQASQAVPGSPDASEAPDASNTPNTPNM